jgi:hypothetical protein
MNQKGKTSTTSPPWIHDRCLSATGAHTWDGKGHCSFPGCEALNPEELMAHIAANPPTHWVARPEVQQADETEGDFWRDMRPALDQASQEKRANNRSASAQFLQQAGIAFESKNAGAHLVVQHRGLTIDFWPGTGLWIPRNRPSFKSRGVRGLIAYIRKHAP